MMGSMVWDTRDAEIVGDLDIQNTEFVYSINRRH